jgi:drug/metabolite transporter (DMT)-like permease
MDSTTTLIVLCGAALLLATAFWRDHRPRTDSLKIRWIPWRFIMLLAGATMMYCLIHLVNLGGVTTGQAEARF